MTNFRQKNTKHSVDTAECLYGSIVYNDRCAVNNRIIQALDEFEREIDASMGTVIHINAAAERTTALHVMQTDARIVDGHPVIYPYLIAVNCHGAEFTGTFMRPYLEDTTGSAA